MPSPVFLLILSTLLPLAGFLLLLFLGKRMGTPLAGYVGTAFSVASFACSLVGMIAWFGVPDNSAWGAGIGPIDLRWPWIPVGATSLNPGGALDLSIYIDSLTIAMFNMVTLVSALVHLFSVSYMREDPRYPRFFTYLGLFGFSMLGLVIGGTALQLLMFWELVGLCSYLLIGFWFEKPAASNAAIKAFVVNRLGDVGFLIGLGILFYHLGNVTLPQMWVALGDAGSGHAITLPGGAVFTSSLLTLMGIGLFCGAIGKSAQFPLHVWLPDAMEGPTPVSALIHAATMVAAGVYLVARVFPILTPDAKLFIAIIGVTTLTMAALIAVAQSDIKRVLAFSTISQLGYMILAMGIGSWVGGLFHLITHAFFKALLFLGAGSVIHAAGHEQEMPQFGGLARKLPVTAAAFGVAVLAIAGVGFGDIGFAGFYSKDMIVRHAGAFAALATRQEHRSIWYWAFFILPTAVAYLTAFYMMRCWMLTFWGKPRNQEVYDAARETPGMWFAMIVLAVLSIIGGSSLLNVKAMIINARRETDRYCNALMTRNPDADAFSGFDTAWPVRLDKGIIGARPSAEVAEPEPDATDRFPLADGELLAHKYLTWAAAVGLALGFLIYVRGYAVADMLMKVPPLKAIHTWLYRRMCFDELYFLVFVSAVRFLSWLSAAFDATIVDGTVNLIGRTVRAASVVVGLNDRYVVDGAVNGVAALAQDVGAAVRAPQTGRIRMYVTILVLAAALGLAGGIIVLLSK